MKKKSAVNNLRKDVKHNSEIAKSIRNKIKPEKEYVGVTVLSCNFVLFDVEQKFYCVIRVFLECVK